MKKFSETVSKGYRLKPRTHKLIKTLQEITERDTDSILYKSCNLYLNFVTLKNIKDNQDENLFSIKRQEFAG